MVLATGFFRCPTVGVTGGWREKGSETGITHSSDKSQLNAAHTSRPVHAVLGALYKGNIKRHALLEFREFQRYEQAHVGFALL